MKDFIIFNGLSDKEIKSALDSLRYKEKKYKKGETIMHAGYTTQTLGIVLKGSVTIENIDILGKNTILSHLERGDFFAETYAILSNEAMAVTARANEDCRILFLNIYQLIHSFDASIEPWRSKMISNLLIISSHKNLFLSNRVLHTSPRTIRGRLISYLSFVSAKLQKSEFDVPFDRQQLADYLNVDRTALSKEISKMQNEGIIYCRKNHFILLE